MGRKASLDNEFERARAARIAANQEKLAVGWGVQVAGFAMGELQ